ncbi:hypothetical protein D3C85_1295610 [compost metagenome]
MELTPDIQFQRVTAGENHIAVFPDQGGFNGPGAKRDHVNQGGRVDHHHVVTLSQHQHKTLKAQIVLLRQPGAVAIDGDTRRRREAGGVADLFERRADGFLVINIHHLLHIAQGISHPAHL